MAIEMGEQLATIKRQERSCRIIIQTPVGGTPQVEIGRELVTSIEGKVISREEVAQIVRSLPQVASDAVTLGGRKFTGAQIAEAIAAFADKWRAEDIAAAELQRQAEAAEAAEIARRQQEEAARAAAALQ